MIDVELLAICEASAVDRDTNSVSLFTLVERVQINPATVPPGESVPVPFVVVAMLRYDNEDVGTNNEIRFVFVSDVAPAASILAGDPARAPRWQPGPELKMRLRMIGVLVPRHPGDYSLYLEHRQVGSVDWTRAGVKWRMQVAESTAAAGATPATA